ncbi:hypothetical protein Acr_02g0005740 [Actinidia rufa]|uniref:Uncharacterized protein n=1 Tax=Actinidia rufa TaxID=165716 RepID=A0A7J0E771_9ERIC|nr:hypothetical protein Acr_02g0005740 [Actinidia rufa]
MSQDIDCCKQALQSLTATMGRKISEGAQKTKESFSSACIYRVPEELRKLKESAYTPRLVSIGPLHSKDKHLESRMQDIKMSYVNSLLCRMTDGSEEDAKKCYTEEVDNLNEEMLVVDGCFILELLYRYYLLTHPKEEPTEESNEITNEMPKEEIIDPVFDISLMHITVQHDLLLLENQLPFCVLEKLFHITVDKIPGVAKPKKYYHILHIIHNHCHPLDPPKGEYHRELMPSASDLDYAGVKFVGTKNDLFKVKFTYQSCLESVAPEFRVYVTSYAFLMDMLVNSAKDVEVLQKAGVIQNYLGADQDASDLFNKLCKEVVIEKFFFSLKRAIKLSSTVNAIGRQPWRM